MTLYGLLGDFTELQDDTGEVKVYRALHNSVEGFYVTVEEEDEQMSIPLYDKGGITTKLIDVTFRLSKEKSNDTPADDSDMMKFIKEQYEPGIFFINEDLSGKPIIEISHVTYASSRYNTKERCYKGYSRIRLTLRSVN